MLGCIGCLWSAAQGVPLELPTLLRATWSPAVLLPFLGFGLAMFTFYSLVPLELRWGGAALLNVSLLASDLWTALARYLFLGKRSACHAELACCPTLCVACCACIFAKLPRAPSACLHTEPPTFFGHKPLPRVPFPPFPVARRRLPRPLIALLCRLPGRGGLRHCALHSLRRCRSPAGGWQRAGGGGHGQRPAGCLPQGGGRRRGAGCPGEESSGGDRGDAAAAPVPARGAAGSAAQPICAWARGAAGRWQQQQGRRRRRAGIHAAACGR